MPMPMPMTPGVPVMARSRVWPGVAGNGDSYLDYNSILPLRTLLVSCPDCLPTRLYSTKPGLLFFTYPTRSRSAVIHDTYKYIARLRVTQSS